MQLEFHPVYQKLGNQNRKDLLGDQKLAKIADEYCRHRSPLLRDDVELIPNIIKI